MHCAVSSCKVHRLNRFAKNTEDPGLKLSEDNKRKLTFHNRPNIKSVFNNGWWVDAYPSSYPLDPPLVVRYGNYYKRYFSHLGPLVLLFFTKGQSQNRGPRHNALPLNTLMPRILRLGACERIIVHLK